MSYWECLQASEILWVSTTCTGLSDPASCKDSAATEYCPCKAFLFTSYAFLLFSSHSGVHGIDSLSLKVNYCHGNSWLQKIQNKFRHSPTFSLPKTQRCHLHRRWRESSELLSLVQDFLPSVELLKFLKLCRAKNLVLRSLSPQPQGIGVPTQWLWSGANPHTSSSLQN